MNFKRVFVVIGTPFLIATLMASFIPLKAMLIIIIIAFVAFGVSFLVVKKEYSLLVKVAIIAFIVGAGLYTVKYQLDAVPISMLNGKTAVVDATVTDIIKEGAGSNGYQVTITNHPFTNAPKKFKANIYAPNALSVDYYDKIKLEVEFFEIGDMSTLDVKSIYRSDNIHTFGYAQNPPIERYSPELKPPAYYLNSLNMKLCNIIDLNLDKPTAALCKAMLLGDTSDIDQLTKHRLSNAGIIHIASVSGLHVSVITGVLLLLMSLFKLKKRTNAVIIICGVWFFVALTGFSVSSIRAGIMLTIMQAGVFFHEKADGMNSLFIASILIVLMNPFAIADAGFMLTFTCTLGIVTLSLPFTKMIKDGFGIHSKIGSALASSISISLCVTLCCLPILITMAKGFNIATVVMNLIAVPLTGIIVGITILFVILSPIKLITSGLSIILTLLCRIITWSCEFLSKLDFLFIGLDYGVVNIVIAVSIAAIIFVAIFYRKAVLPALVLSIIAILISPLIYRTVTFSNLILTTFSTYTGSYIVAEQKGKCDVFVLKSDGSSSIPLAKYLSGRNIPIVSNYVILEDKSASYADIAMFTKVKKVSKIFIDSDNKLADKFDCTKLNSGEERVIMDYLTIVEDDTIMISKNGFDIVATSDNYIAQNLNCEILFFDKKNSDEIEHFSSECVILLNECDNLPSDGVICAQKQQIILDVSDKIKLKKRVN